MDGFFISITNNLLEPKHVEKMGQAVWLYMYLIDKMTDISEGQGIVNGGYPVEFESVHEKLGISRRTYSRMVDELRDTGYINTMRAQYGLYITINKAKKNFGKKATAPVKKPRSAKSGTTEIQMRHNLQSDVPKSVTRSATNGTSLYKEYNNSNNNSNNKVAKATGETPEKPDRRRPDINAAFEYWQEQTGFTITAKYKANRRAASNLINKHTLDGVKKFINGVALAQEDEYAPRIGDFCALQQKLNDLMVWGKQRGISDNKRKNGVVEI